MNNMPPKSLPSKQTVSTIILVILLTAAGVIMARKNFKKPTVENQTESLVPSNLKKVIQPNAFFYTKIFLDRNNTFISIPYKFENDPLIIWLYLQPEIDAEALVRLVSHPQLEDLDWHSITDKHLTLYQRLNNYHSIENFLEDPPASEQIVMDFKFAELEDYSQLTNNLINGDIELVKFNYILTTYVPPRIADQVLYYETIIDASTANINIEDEMIWHIQAPDATEDNPFYLGTIHVDYR